MNQQEKNEINESTSNKKKESARSRKNKKEEPEVKLNEPL